MRFAVAVAVAMSCSDDCGGLGQLCCDQQSRSGCSEDFICSMTVDTGARCFEGCGHLNTGCCIEPDGTPTCKDEGLFCRHDYACVWMTPGDLLAPPCGNPGLLCCPNFRCRSTICCGAYCGQASSCRDASPDAPELRDAGSD